MIHGYTVAKAEARRKALGWRALIMPDRRLVRLFLKTQLGFGKYR
jgi:hypothetical protein